MSPKPVVLDASALVDVLRAAPDADWVSQQLKGRQVHAPGHQLAEVLSALGRQMRAGEIDVEYVDARLAEVQRWPLRVDELGPLLVGAWSRRDSLQLADALYVELAAQLDTVVITTDRRLARATPLAVAPPE
jgi:predicted nucleic acid-binding protein